MPTPTAPEPERIPKGDGKFYLARKPVTVQVLGSGVDEDLAVVVLRTHDADRYLTVAANAWRAHTDAALPAPERVWVRLVPWDPTGAGCSRAYAWVEPTARGAVPALWFSTEDASVS